MTLEQTMAEGRERLRRDGQASASRLFKQRRAEMRQMSQAEQIAFYNALPWTEKHQTLAWLSWGARREIYRQERARRKEWKKDQEYRLAKAMEERLKGPVTVRDLRDAAKSVRISAFLGFGLGVCATLFAGWWFMSPPAAPALFESSCHGAGGVYDPSVFVITNGSFIWTQATCITDPAKFESKERFLEPMITARW
jgi:hypothetical protein